MYGKTDNKFNKFLTSNYKRAFHTDKEIVLAWQNPEFKKEMQARKICKRCGTYIQKKFAYCYSCFKKRDKAVL